ncbi:Uu.00g074900.m01.CDS01 [Anthostomella pinea]|uniref:Uu.00g074900.m01.CDS01 n=1 Tax=Anthostomella pinea TaxID=933095 RepID=A0AAI8VWG3_9PEZI|nr:Uu.00g074900.m01.CDS01 [Anthostomella pinea]
MARPEAQVVYGNVCISCNELREAMSFIAADEGQFGREKFGRVRPRLLKSWSFEFARDRSVVEREWLSERMWKLRMVMMSIQRGQRRTDSPLDADDALQPLLLVSKVEHTEEKDRMYQDFSAELMSEGSERRHRAHNARAALWKTIVGNTPAEGGTQAPDEDSWLLNPTVWFGDVAGVYTNGFGLKEVMGRNRGLLL